MIIMTLSCHDDLAKLKVRYPKNIHMEMYMEKYKYMQKLQSKAQ